MRSWEPGAGKQSSKQHVEGSCTNFAHASDIARQRQRQRPRLASCVEDQSECKECGDEQYADGAISGMESKLLS
jgi:hypothetical protein